MYQHMLDHQLLSVLLPNRVASCITLSMSKFYSCPKCHKVISDILDTNSVMFVGMGAYTKRKCQYCGSKIKLSLFGFLAGAGLYAFVIYCAFIFGEHVIQTQRIENIIDVISVLMLVSMAPISVLVMYVFLPFLLGAVGFRLYK